MVCTAETYQMMRERVNRSRYLAGQVLRYHTWPVIRRQTVADHQWRVTTLVIDIFGTVRFEVLYYALWHDSGEHFSGDVPFGSKTIPGMREAMDRAEAHGRELLGIELPELTELEYAQVKIADLIEMYEFGRREVTMGNRFAEPIVIDTLDKARQVAAKHGLTADLNKWMSNGGGYI